MLRKWISMLLLIAVVLPSVLKTAVCINFLLERERIAAELCENRNDSRSCCKGSCVLKKELNRIHTSETPIPAILKVSTDVIGVVPEPTEKSEIPCLSEPIQVFCRNCAMEQHLPGIDHPPPAA
ncbi:MAG: hypothetical protein JNM00_13120 [Flavobacteriales bacterium]|nr:hypothetical protein [Flavobacteriales bacterium]